MGAGDRGGVVGQRGGGQRGHHPLAVVGAPCGQRGQIGCLSGGHHVVQQVGVATVEQEDDHVVGSLAEALGGARGAPTAILLGERFSAFLAEVCAAYDYVIIDAPPIMAVTDAAIIGAHVGAAVLVVKDGQHPMGEIRAAIQSLDIAGVRAKGFVFNDVNPKSALLGYQRYAYHYTYQS